ncbi:AraC family transcriptional regulator [Lewinella sp. 4G2]|uniref:helix-turn-helix transcriptional regulator n=1 Tax=Lewinella sp. 4G2 TaxID=1803372 RepID=UPI0007B48231|nr:AraC family transcriptional regulator [Lewinella sp. 4G2]OAV43149.1 hypothetical protein A3850_000960 [Lewinella sp. 4G2]
MYINLYSGLLLIGFTQAIVVAVLLLLRARREGRLADTLAAGILLCGAFYVAQWMLGFGNWYDSHDWRTTLMFYVKWANLTAIGPLIWFYFRALVNTDFTWKRRYWWHLLPAALFLMPKLFVITYDWIYWLGIAGESFTDFYDTRGPAAEWENSGGDIISEVENIFFRIQVIVYLILTLKTYRSFRAFLQREMTNTAPLEMRGLRNLVYLFLIGMSMTILLDTSAELFGEATYVAAWPKYLSMSVLLFVAGLQFYGLTPQLTTGLRFERPVPEVDEMDTAASPLVDSSPDAPDFAPLAAQLAEQLSTGHDYLDPNLRLGDLAEKLGTNSSLLSKAINREAGKNFNDYINALRCEAFLERVRRGDHERHTLLSLALDCGFNSKSTFNRAFRKYAGMSPAEATKKGADHDLGRPKT